MNAILKVVKMNFGQVWGLGIFPYRYLAVLKISRKSGADCSALVVRVTDLKSTAIQSDAIRSDVNWL